MISTVTLYPNGATCLAALFHNAWTTIPSIHHHYFMNWLQSHWLQSNHNISRRSTVIFSNFTTKMRHYGREKPIPLHKQNIYKLSILTCGFNTININNQISSFLLNYILFPVKYMPHTFLFFAKLYKIFSKISQSSQETSLKGWLTEEKRIILYLHIKEKMHDASVPPRELKGKGLRWPDI